MNLCRRPRARTVTIAGNNAIGDRRAAATSAVNSAAKLPGCIVSYSTVTNNGIAVLTVYSATITSCTTTRRNNFVAYYKAVNNEIDAVPVCDIKRLITINLHTVIILNDKEHTRIACSETVEVLVDRINALLHPNSTV